MSIEELRKVLGPEAEGRTDEELELVRGFLYLLVELAVESLERDQQENAA